MILAPMPVLSENEDQEEVRKALVNIAEQLNRELDKIRADISALTP